MGYATIRRVPRVLYYQEALKIHDSIKPLRGRAIEIRPLGNRRDADTYHIRKNGDAIELVLYKTPVITFMPDGDVVIFIDGYNSVSTHQFIDHVLNIRAQGARRTTVLTINGQKYTIADNSQVDTMEIAFLAGEESPFLENDWDMSRDVYTYKARQTFGCAVIDHVGIFGNRS